MPVVLTCLQGHQWQTETAGSPPVPTQDHCPVCGDIARTLPPSESSGVSSPDSGTLTHAPAGAPAEAELDLAQVLRPPQGPEEFGRLGNYRVLGVLGSGGMGVVFKAEDLQLRRLVALKAMLPGIAASPANRQRFLREAQAAAAIEHDHIVPIYQVGEDRGIPFLAMQLLKGESLDDRLRREPRLAAAEVIRVGRETAEGLAAAHAQGLIHRDIKPANLWLEGERRRVKVLDFGLARAAAGDSQLTQSGVIVGTPAYMAPEQAAGKPVDGRCDLFSLGCVLYRCSTGELPFRGPDTISTLMAVAMEQPRPPRAANADVPPALSDLIMRLLAKNPAGRPASARDVQLALEVIAREPAAPDTLPVLEALSAEPPTAPNRGEVTAVVPAAAAGLRAKAPGKAALAAEDREALLTRTVAFLVAVVVAALGGLVGAIAGGLVGGPSSLVAGLAFGALAGGAVGYVLGLIVGGAYVGYLAGEAERRRQEKRRATPR
jgi:hypothetical protein